MKKIFFLLFALQIAYFSFAQTNSYQVISSKEYPNNTKTSYIELDFKIGESNIDFITEEIISNPLISNFSFYNKSNSSKCMFTSDMSIETETIVQMIYDINETYYDNDNRKFIESWTNSTGMEYFFQIDGIINDLQRIQIAEALMKDKNITNAVINGSGCKILTSQDISPEYIEVILDKCEVGISETSIE